VDERYEIGVVKPGTAQKTALKAVFSTYTPSPKKHNSIMCISIYTYMFFVWQSVPVK
jgi:hypothetical protein